ncbi:YdeI/OmpD-associated family protein [Flavihumibacter sp.]|uniref:YdeI/OmpD-associated family protein n=1 Tax=Flavihumibacter sp. TaxID=1913981 RepID=UPI002FCA6E27
MFKPININPKVDTFLSKAKKWKEEMTLLREIILDCKLEEDFKWMHPCYTHKGSNIVLIHGFKEYCALLFFKGVLMKDEKGILIQQTENVQDRRQIRFKNLAEIQKSSAVLKAYIKEAIKIEESGVKVEFRRTEDFPMPEEFEQLLKKDKMLRAAFDGLTPGRKRGYLLYFSAARQAKTRESRIEKYLPKILAGKGVDD